MKKLDWYLARVDEDEHLYRGITLLLQAINDPELPYGDFLTLSSEVRQKAELLYGEVQR